MLRVWSLGAGVQSSAGYIGSVLGLLPPADVAIFADTHDEAEATYAWLDKLEAFGGHEVPILRRSAGSLSAEVLRSMQETKSGFVPIPTYVVGEKRESMGRRQCTRTHKTQVVYRAVRELLGLRKGQLSPPGAAEQYVGISVDEATRAKPSQYKLLTSRWPLLYDVPMRRHECSEYVESVMGEVPPRSSCVYCPFRSDRDWAAMKRGDSESFGKAVAFEREMRALDPSQYLHDSCRPLAEVVFDDSRTLDLFTGECEGMCGV